jgi:hypothetical protein
MDQEAFNENVKKLVRETIDSSFSDEEVELYLYLTSIGTTSEDAIKVCLSSRTRDS